MSGILVVLDGAEDCSYGTLGGQTPLSYGIPGWDSLPGGCWCTCPNGKPVGTLAGVGTLLGLEPWELPAGRAWLEAVAADCTGGAEYALRCNLVTVDGEGRVFSPCAAGYSAEEKQAAWSLLKQEAAGGRVVPLADYRGLLLLPMAVPPKEDGRPPHQALGHPWEPLLPKWEGESPIRPFTEMQPHLLQTFNRPDRFLRAVLWSGAAAQPLPTFAKRQGCQGAVVTATQVVRGMACAMGMEAPLLAEWTGDVDTDLVSKTNTVLHLADRVPLVLLHLNGADEASHRRSLQEKVTFLQKVDREVLPKLASSGHRVLLCTDHGTCCEDGTHMGGLQPVRLLGWTTQRPIPKQAREAVTFLLSPN